MLIDTGIPILLAYLLLGAIAGVVGGLLGLGGGIIIVPALLYLFIRQGLPAEILMHLAVATSLVTIVFTSISSTFAHHRRRAVLWPQVKLFVPGIIVGGVLGAMIVDHISSDNLRIAFGIFEILVAIQIGFAVEPSAHRELPGFGGMFVAGGGIGTLSTVLGIGGGTLTVPFLLWCNVNIRNAVATSSASGLPIALVGAIAMIITGWNSQSLPAGSIGYVYWPAAMFILVASIFSAPLGAHLTHTLPIKLLKRIFAFVVFCVGIRMLI
ncbi:MAG: sulfite exporter TauE/SafE family protein [Gammaproteobacteria bacterium]|nr:sulfite exporter TauE/SafE family protein [Gammaproteobacteria bacterium]